MKTLQDLKDYFLKRSQDNRRKEENKALPPLERSMHQGKAEAYQNAVSKVQEVIAQPRVEDVYVAIVMREGVPVAVCSTLDRAARMPEVMGEGKYRILKFKVDAFV